MVGIEKWGNITFYYNSNELFDDVGILSAYMTKNLATESGSLMDEYIISDDEKDIYNVCLRQSIPDIYEAMLKIMPGMSDAFAEVKIDADETDGLSRKQGTYIEFNLKNNKAYNANVLSLIDSTLHNCLKYGVLVEFYSTCIHADLLRLAQDKYAINMRQLSQRLFQLKKKQTHPLY